MKSLQPVITDVEFYEALDKFNHRSRVAILFTLSTDLSPQYISKLNWSEAKQLRLGKSAVKILNSIPRQLFSELVFWQVEDYKIKPLSNLTNDIESLIGIFTLDEFRELYENMVYIEESSRSFIRTMSKSYFERTM